MWNCLKCRSVSILLLICICCHPAGALGAVETVVLPVTLDYPFIRSVLVSQLYTAPGERAIVVDETREDCLRIELRNPQVIRERSTIRIGSDIRIQAGIPLLGSCVGQVEWDGYIEILQRPVIDRTGWRAHFETVDSRLYDAARRHGSIASRFWTLVKTHVHPYLDRMSVDLVPPLAEIKAFLPLVFLPAQRLRLHSWLESVRPGPVRVEEAGVKVDMMLDVETDFAPPTAARELSPSEIERLSKVWEAWDAFLVYEIETLIGKPVTDAERGVLLEILLGNRHGFYEALEDKTIGPNMVRQQFVWTWQRIAPILRKHLVERHAASPLGYLAFFTAADALVALDRLGPSLGLEISRDGLIRLARLLSAELADPALSYSYTLDPELRKFFGFGPPLDDAGPTSADQELEIPDASQQKPVRDDPLSRLWDLLLPRAWASSPEMLDQIRQWIPSAQNRTLYLGRVRTLLDDAADRVLEGNGLAVADGDRFFEHLLLSTAWQESCWRQFIVRNGKIRYLISYNRSSVGLMQINERVWRGIYRVESLRWNIRYNVQAGTEILNLYLRTFSLREINPATPADLDRVAQVTYAMYNGGPGQLKKFFSRKSANALYRSDLLFLEKYRAAKAGRLDRVALCLYDP